MRAHQVLPVSAGQSSWCCTGTSSASCISRLVILVLYGHIKCFLYQQVSHPGAVRAHQVLPVSAGQSSWCCTGTSSASCISRSVILVLYGHIKCFLYQQVSHPGAVRAHQVLPVSAGEVCTSAASYQPRWLID